MIRSTLLRTISLGLAAFSLSVGASAQNQSSASLSNYGYRLVDLDVNDGVTPTISFEGVFGQTYGRVNSNDPGWEAVNFIFDFPGTIDTSILIGNSFAAASTSSTLVNAHGNNTGIGDYWGKTTFSANYTLSANTKIVFFGNASGSYAGATGGTNSAGSQVYWEFGDSLSGAGHRAVDYSRDLYSGNPNAGNEFNEQFEREFSNNSATALHGTMSLGVGVAGTIASAVPEPASYALLSAGLLLIGLRRRAGCPKK